MTAVSLWHKNTTVLSVATMYVTFLRKLEAHISGISRIL